MKEDFSITVDWEDLDSGSEEERAAFGALGILAYDVWLTEGNDAHENQLRKKPLLSPYHFAEWLAWNWWKLRWEPRPQKITELWLSSHRTAGIGGGYIWPNLEFSSDGRWIALDSWATADCETTPFRYINTTRNTIRAESFEETVDHFIEHVTSRLASRRVANSNLGRIWASVLEERSSEESIGFRKLEALLGLEPDSDIGLVERTINQQKLIGRTAVEEIAANRSDREGADWTRLVALATHGTPSKPEDRVQLKQDGLKCETAPAWRLGAEGAKRLRAQEGLPTGPIADNTLAHMFGIRASALAEQASGFDELKYSFLIRRDGIENVWLRSRFHTGRRFEVARLLGDVGLEQTQEAVIPATRSETFRQKRQRAFAAEFLSPFAEVEEMLAGDFSLENQQEVASTFQVSELVIRTMLVNNGLIHRAELDDAQAKLER